MPQKQCPWCGQLGSRYTEDRTSMHYDGPPGGPHDDGSPCVCRHVTSPSRRSAILAGGRYWDGTAWVCLGGCGTAPPLTAEEMDWADGNHPARPE
jgi:hypothetical protein